MTSAQKQVRNSDAYMIGFIAKYVDCIGHYSERRVQVSYYPHEDSHRIVTRNGKNRIDAFRKCMKAAMNDTDKFWKHDGGDREIYRSCP